MNKTMFFALGMAALMVGCTAADKVTNRTLNQEEVMSKMSLEDKAHFVIGVGMAGFSGDDAVIGATKSLVPGAAGTTYPLDSLGIPAVVLADGPAGLRIDATREGDSATYYCTHFLVEGAISHFVGSGTAHHEGSYAEGEKHSLVHVVFLLK